MAQISKGHQYEPTGDKSQVTAENLNDLADKATLLVGAIKEQDEVVSSINEDELLIAQGNSLVKIKKSNFIGITDIGAGYINFGAPLNAQGTSAKFASDGFQIRVNDYYNQNGGNGYEFQTFYVPTAGGNEAESVAVQAHSLVIREGGINNLNSFWKSALTIKQNSKLIIHGRNRTDDFTPSGTIVAFAGQTAPSGWIVCDGRTLDAYEIDYTEGNFDILNDNTPVSKYYWLWMVIGTTYGGTGMDSFKIPDLRGEFIRGYDHGNGADPRTFGSKQKDLLKAHKHIASNNDCQNYAGVNGVGTGNYNAWCDTNGIGSGAGAALTGDGQHPEQVVLDVPTVGHETRPRNIALNYIIKI